MLADTYPEGNNKVLANTYRARKMIRLVSMKHKKFHVWGKYEHLQSYPHNGMSQYKRNVGCCADVDDKGPKSRQNKKKKTAKQIPFPKDEEEEGCL
jgi:hypothetical protein